MPPKKNNITQGEPAAEENDETKVGFVAGEVTKLKAVVEELVAQSLQNQTHLENVRKDTAEHIAILRKEAAENQSKLLNLMSEFIKGREEEDEGQGSIGQKKTNSVKTISRVFPSMKPLGNGDDMLEFRQSMKKILLSSFRGEDPAGWIARAEVYFNVQETRESVRVNLAHLCMEGSTIHFFQSLLNEYEELTWEDLKRELLERYGGMREGSVYDQLVSLKQTGSVEDYIRRLKDDIRARMRSLHVANPLSRGRMMNVARAIDVEMEEVSHVVKVKPNVLGKTGPKQNRGNWGGNGPGPGEKKDWGGQSRTGLKDRGANHLTYQDLLERKQKGMCYKCGGLFGPLHRCPVKQLRVIMVNEEIQVPCDKGEEESDNDDEEYEVVAPSTALNICTIASDNGDQPRTMKLRGMIGEIPMLFLIDSGATHNFISRRLVEALGWKCERTKQKKVLMGDGHKSETQGVCRGIKVRFDEGEFEIDAFLFYLEDMDIILGMSWLMTLGETTVDWKKQIIKVQTKQGERLLRGIPHGNSLIMSVCDLLEDEGKAEDDGLNPERKSILDNMLQHFSEVFEEPKGLSPVRVKEHQINLKPGQEPINVRPYRYAYHQKNEIEKQVLELMEVGYVRHSQSAYSSPVILLKKKNNKWRTCVDYRALNKATIQDKFLIPVIEEFLDELHGARFFSKLDLRSGYHQVRMREEDIPKTAFRTHEGKFWETSFGALGKLFRFSTHLLPYFRIYFGFLGLDDENEVLDGFWSERSLILNPFFLHFIFDVWRHILSWTLCLTMVAGSWIYEGRLWVVALESFAIETLGGRERENGAFNSLPDLDKQMLRHIYHRRNIAILMFTFGCNCRESP
ncbi:hypothetical protein V8G54_032327 [Vigna mungo]|uniref:Retrotransposon-related protein n=1 Tax=Vigna mungo TaxID=3915 RepID=A0AAQ3MMP6_VIGMU